jgi:two-component system heavy metal sensor histidine kinase CusS
MRRRPARLRTRITIAFLLVNAFGLLAALLVLYAVVARDETRELDDVLRVQAAAVAHLVRLRGPRAIREGGFELPDVPVSVPRYIALYAPDGRVLVHTRTFAGPPPPLDPGEPGDPNSAVSTLDVEVGARTLRACVVRLPDGHRLFYGVPRDSLDRDLRFLLQVLFILFGVTTFLSLLVASWIARRLARDVGAIATVARSVAEGDLQARVAGGADGSHETRELGHDLDEMIARIDALVNAQRTFVSHAAHELRSPLATLRGEVQLALRRARSAEEYRSTLAEMLEVVDGLTLLAEDLLTLARVQGQGADTGWTTVREVLDEALRMSRGPALARGVEVAVGEPPGALDLAIRGARGDLSRALRNLVDNAVAHSPPRSTVRVEVMPGDDVVVVRVEDRGEGVPPHEVPHLFTPFYRGAKEQDGPLPGAGLGLTIAREIARAHGGDVTFDPSYRDGARFVITLVRAPPR